MKCVLTARHATVEIPSKVWECSPSFFVQCPIKEVILQLPQQKRKLLQEFQEVKTTFELLLKQWLTSPKLQRIQLINIPLLNTDALPPEFVQLAYQIIGGLLLALLLLSIILYILSSGYYMINKEAEAEKWQKNIRKGLIYGLTAPFVILLIAYTIHFFLNGKQGYIPIFKSQ